VVEEGVQGEPVALRERTADHPAPADLEDRHLVAIGADELVGDDDVLPKEIAPLADVGLDVGKRLEETERHDDLADTARVHHGVWMDRAIAGIARGAQVQQGETVAVGVTPEPAPQPGREHRIGRRDLEVGPVLEREHDLVAGERRTGGQQPSPGALLRDPESFDSRDPTVRIAIERVAARVARGRESTDRQAEKDASESGGAHAGSSVSRFERGQWARSRGTVATARAPRTPASRLCR